MKKSRSIVPTLTVIVGMVALLMGLPAANASDRSNGSSKWQTVTVKHAPVTPTSVQGSGVGTVRYFSIPITVGRQQGADWFMVGTLTTLSIDATIGKEVRSSNLNLVLGSIENQLVIGGVSYYAAAGSTLDVGSKTVRPVVGGSGKYAGARGSVTSTNLGSEGWTHVFKIRVD